MVSVGYWLPELKKGSGVGVGEGGKGDLLYRGP
jgi:hypothetical protein